MFTQRKNRAGRLGITEISTLLVFLGGFLAYMVENTATILFFSEIQMKIGLLIQVIVSCKIRSYAAAKYAILMLLVLHIPHSKKSLNFFSINRKHLGRFFSFKGVYIFKVEVSCQGKL